VVGVDVVGVDVVGVDVVAGVVSSPPQLLINRLTAISVVNKIRKSFFTSHLLII
jgi:hypothetical protein